MALAGLAAFAAANPDILPAYNAGTTLHKNPEAIRAAIIKTVGAYVTVIAIADCHRKGIKFTSPRLDKTVYENLLIMLGRVDADGNPDTLLLNTYRHSGAMGADHEITNSTFALLVAASSLGDPVSSLISAISTCYGPLHMGACESAFKSMEKVGSVENARLLIESVKRGERRLYGYGHRMYRTVDPRIERVRGIVKDLGNDSHPVLPIASEIDRLASTDEYFIKRDLHANVDLFVVFVGIGLYVLFSYFDPLLNPPNNRENALRLEPASLYL
jgi:citrate synthase